MRSLLALSIALFCAACSANASDASEDARVNVRDGVHPNKDCLTCDNGGGGGPGGDPGDPPPPGADPPPGTIFDPKYPIDLLPYPDHDTYCPRDKEGDLVVNIHNRGTEASPETTTRVTFAGVGDSSLPTPAIPPGMSAQLRTPIPRECFLEGGGDCVIRISADAHLEISEASEANNEVNSICPGF